MMLSEKEKRLGSFISREIAGKKDEILEQWLNQRKNLIDKYDNIIDENLIADCQNFLTCLCEVFETGDRAEFQNVIEQTVSKRIEQGFNTNELQNAVRLWRKIILDYFVERLFDVNELSFIKEIIYSMFYFVLETISEQTTSLLSEKIKSEREDKHISNQRFRQIFEQSPIIMLTTDKDGKVIDVNPYCQSVFGDSEGESRESIIGTYIGDIKLFKHADILFHIPSLLEGKPFSLEHNKITTSIGKRVLVNIKGVPLTNENDEHEGSVILMEDITEKIALQESTSRRAEQLEVINQITKVITSSLKMDDLFTAIVTEIQKLIEFDRTTIALLEKGGDELKVITLYPEKTAPTVEKGLKKAGTSAEWVIKHQRAHIVGNLVENEQFREDNLLFEEGIRSYINIPMFSKDRIVGSFSLGSKKLFAYDEEDLHVLEQIAGHIAVAIENALMYSEIQSFAHVLEKEVELRTREVREIRDYLNLIIESSGDAVMVVDENGTITIFNRAAELLTGYTAPEIINTDDLPFLTKKGILHAAFQSKEPMVKELTILSKSGEKIPVRVSLSQLKAKNKSVDVLGVVGIFRDLRVEKQLEQQLIQAEKLSAIGKLSADIAHEVNNPLSVIKTSIRIVSDRLGTKTEVQKNLKIINDEIDRISRIINNLLDFYRPLSFKVSPVDINRIIVDILMLVERQLNKKKISVETQLEKYLPKIMISPDRFKQVLFNLIRNAEDSMPDGGKMVISTGKSGQNVVIKVTDMGHGIKKEDLDQLFVPFFTTKKEGKGTGLGLSVTYGIVKNSGGNIDIESSPGKGTTFIITLPIKNKENNG